MILSQCLAPLSAVNNAIHSAATECGELITLVAGKRWSLLMAANNDELYDRKSLRYTIVNTTALHRTL